MAFVVIDTNVFFAALLRPKGRTERHLGVILKHFTPAFSDPTFYELAEKVSIHPKILALTTPVVRRDYLLGLEALGHFVEPTAKWTGCRDPKDDKFLDVAYAVKAEVILTGDADLLSLHPFRGIPILTPNAFLAGRNLQ